MTADDLRHLPLSDIHSLPPLLQALWHDADGDWAAAHALAQDVDTPDGAWVHAYLHRREGDQGNARYWYRLAAKPVCATSLPDEWNAIANALLRSSAQG